MKVNGFTSYVDENGQVYVKKNGSVYESEGQVTELSEIARFAIDEMGISYLAEEVVYEICLNGAGDIIGVAEVSHGGVNWAKFNNREIFQKALLIGAVSIILVHNHPSGVTRPSKEDKEVTKNVLNAGEVIGIKVLDHIIVGHQNWTAFSQLGLLE